MRQADPLQTHPCVVRGLPIKAERRSEEIPRAQQKPRSRLGGIKVSTTVVYRITKLELAAQSLGKVAPPRKADGGEIRVALAVQGSDNPSDGRQPPWPRWHGSTAPLQG